MTIICLNSRYDPCGHTAGGSFFNVRFIPPQKSDHKVKKNNNIIKKI